MENNITYEKWIKEWLDSRKGFVKEATYATYSVAIYNHIIPTLGMYLLSELTEKKIQETVIYWLREGRKDGKGGLQEKTVKDLVNLIKLSLKDASKEHFHISKSLEIKYPLTENITKHKVLTIEDQICLTKFIELNMHIKSIGILFCLHTGVRIGELCAIQWRDIDLVNKTISINKTIQRIFVQEMDGASTTKIIITTPKTKNSNRIIPLSSTLHTILKKVCPTNQNAYLITNKEKFMEPRSYRRYYNKFIKKLNITPINFHCLRHTFATRLIERGVDYKTVSELLGHASITITLNIYVHPQMEEKRKAVELMK